MARMRFNSDKQAPIKVATVARHQKWRKLFYLAFILNLIQFSIIWLLK